jgi:hypothetical protein
MADDNRLVIVRLVIVGLLRMDGKAGREEDRDCEQTNRARDEPHGQAPFSGIRNR